MSLAKTFIFSTTGFFFVYLSRGLGILSFIPGSVILLLLLIAVVSGLVWGIVGTLRY